MEKNQEEYSLYDGEIKLLFNKAKHIYTVNNEIVYGVTSAVGILNKPALMYWAVNQAIDYLKQNMTTGMIIDEINKTELLTQAKTAHRKKKDAAADIGTAVHDYLEKYIKARINWKTIELPVNERIKKGVEAFIKWAKDNKVQFISSERKIYSRIHQYAGTLDVEAIVNGRLSIVDFKTSSGIYPEYFLQTAAYARALEEETGNKYKNIWILRIPKDGTEFSYAKNEDIDIYFKSFLGCLENYQRQMLEKKLQIEELKTRLI